MRKKGLVVVVLLIVAGAGGWFYWKELHESDPPRGIVSGNGRIEATEVDVASKQQGEWRKSRSRKVTW